ncbi:uncharacterized protein SOCE26_091050 [Sorangium cellulosum]|uniref:Killer suppression protein HigA n=1 Tax=Sorangium cellulosum TaxID=56 RepID=A0A2L0F7R9_SORCE|nr:uncharacterized protein SOCE26_091050 [Sorangium cellulosum]
MELSFANRSLREICEKQTVAVSQLGSAVAGKLRRRLADLRAAANVKELVAGRPRQIGNGRHMSISLGDDYLLVFCVNHQKVPMLDVSNVDWAKVDRVQILRIERNHE